MGELAAYKSSVDNGKQLCRRDSILFESCNIFDFFCLCMPSHVEHSEGKLSHTVISHMVTLRIAYLLNEAVGQNLTREMVVGEGFEELLFGQPVFHKLGGQFYEIPVNVGTRKRFVSGVGH